MTKRELADSLSEEALILRLHSAEHDFVERKSRGDRSGWLQTAVAFANSVPIGQPAILFVGVDDDGKPQQDQSKLEDLMKGVSGMLDRAYPPVHRNIVPIHLPDGACLAVIVNGSPLRPHFAGKSYVRKGPETLEASEDQFNNLIADRLSKPREILKWKGKEVNVEVRISHNGRILPPYAGRVTVVDCNQFFVTLEKVSGEPFGGGQTAWYPLDCVTVSADSQGLKLEVMRSPY